jgi:hypothetical protein
MWPFKSPQASERDEPTLISSVPAQAAVIPPVQSIPQPDQDEQPFVTFTGHLNERLGIPLVLRAPLSILVSFGTGFSLGASQGATKGAYRYRAENAHRLPTTQTGWFLYQKSKNYHAMLGGLKEGARFGSICAGWATLFLFAEELVDRSRARIFARRDDEIATGQRDAGSTVIAGLTVAGIYSWKRGFDHFAAAGAARVALRTSLAYGLVQDLATTLRGNPPGYISWLKSKFFD